MMAARAARGKNGKIDSTVNGGQKDQKMRQSNGGLSLRARARATNGAFKEDARAPPATLCGPSEKRL
jgi:hypothetical protein